MIDFPLEQVLENEVAEIGLKMKDKNVLPGKDKLKGELKVKIRKHWNIRHVILTLTRREYVAFEHSYITWEPDPKNPQHKIAVTHTEHYRADERYDVWKDVMEGGLFHHDKEEYEFKYKIEKNQGHPASFSYVAGSCRCAIEYFFTGNVISGDHNHSLTVILPIKIQAPEQEGTPVNMAVQKHLQGCCCSDLGIFAMQLKVDDPTIFIFQPITGRYFIDNTQCKSNIVQINCQVHETITATGRKDGVGPAMTKNITNLLSNFSIAGMPSGQKREDPLNLHIPVTVRPPQDIASSKGTILSRNYSLSVFPSFDRCICSGDGGLSCPLYISNNEDVIEAYTNPNPPVMNSNFVKPGFQAPVYVSPNNNITMPSTYNQPLSNMNLATNPNMQGFNQNQVTNPNQPFSTNNQFNSHLNPQNPNNFYPKIGNQNNVQFNNPNMSSNPLTQY